MLNVIVKLVKNKKKSYHLGREVNIFYSNGLKKCIIFIFCFPEPKTNKM